MKGLLAFYDRSYQGLEDQAPCASSLGAARRSTRSARDDAASLASRTSAVNFFHARALRLVALDIFFRAREWLLHFLRARAAAVAAAAAVAVAAEGQGKGLLNGILPRPAPSLGHYDHQLLYHNGFSLVLK